MLRTSFYSLLIFLTLCNSGCIRKPKEEKKDIQYGDLLINGRNYVTVKIGAQWWMAENLVTTAYNNGLPIPAIEGSDENTWSTIQSAAKDKGTQQNYNWYAVANDSLNIAPPGWHVPTDDDWKKLEEHLGMTTEQTDEHGWRGSNEGDKLKMDGNETWPTYNKNEVWGTNESGFAAKATLCRMFSGNYCELDDKSQPITTFFWTSTEGPGNTAYYRLLDYKKASIFRAYGSKNYGFAVRLVMNL